MPNSAAGLRFSAVVFLLSAAGRSFGAPAAVSPAPSRDSQDAGRVQWKTLPEMYDLYMAREEAQGTIPTLLNIPQSGREEGDVGNAAGDRRRKEG